MNELFRNIPLPAAADPVEYPSGDDAVTLIYKNIEGLNEYLPALEKAGFQTVDSHEMGDNCFATLRREGLTLSLDWFDGELRLTADPYTAPYRMSDPCPRTAQTTLWQHEVDHTMIDCGMCFIVRCCDGSFFLVDSGDPFQVNDNDRIHRFMRERTPAGEKIRIAGWYLTHAHSDHVGKFSDFLRYNMDDCVLETVYLNFPEVYPPEGAGWRARGDCLYGRNISAQLAEMPEVKVVKLHTGQRFAVRNLHFTVLCTHENVFPTENTDFNNTTTVLMMEAEGTKVLFCGDASDDESAIMERRYGDLLACDILQVAHHGHHGCSAAFYEFTKAKAALFSNTQIFFDKDLELEKEANGTILKYAQEYYISSNGTVEADLPYTKFKCLPDETFEDFGTIRRLWGYEYTPERKAELYEAYLARGGKVLHPFYHHPNEKNWHDVL